MTKTVEEIRYLNALFLRKRVGGVTEFAKRMHREQPQMSNIVGDKPIKNIGPRMARLIESTFDYAKGWLDTPHPDLWERRQADVREEPQHYSPSDGFLSATITEEAMPSEDGSWTPQSNRESPREIRCNSPDQGVYAILFLGDRHAPRIRHGEVAIIEPNHKIQSGDEVVIATKSGAKFAKLFLYKKGERLYFEEVSNPGKKSNHDQSDVESMHFIASIKKMDAR